MAQTRTIQTKVIQAKGSINSSYTMKLTVAEDSIGIDNNSSFLSWRLDLISASFSFSGVNSTIKVNIDGEVYNNTASRSINQNQVKEIAGGTKLIKHNSDGTKSINIGFSYNQASTLNFTPGNMSSSVIFNLTTIPRASTITALDADIGSSTLITINRKSPNFTHTLKYTFKNLSGTVATKTSQTNVGWTIPTTFYNQIPTEQYGICKIICDTYNGKTKIGTNETQITVSANLKKCRPTINSIAIIDTNKTLPTGLTTTALTGDNKKFIKYISDAKGTINATANCGTTMKQYTFKNGNQSKYGSSNTYTLENIQTNDFTIIAKDSRNFYTIDYREPTMVNYIKLTIANFTVQRESPTSNRAIMNINGKWFNGNFGKVSNTLELRTAYRETNTTGNFTRKTYTLKLDANNYSLNNVIIGEDLNYQKNYDFYITLEDKCMQEKKQILIKKGIAVFDYGERDFRVNGDFRYYFRNGETTVVPRQFQSGYITRSAEIMDTIIVLDKSTNKIVPQVVRGYLRARKGTGDFVTDFQNLSLANQDIININFPFASETDSNILLMRMTRKDGKPFDSTNNLCLSIDLQEVTLQF